MIGSEIFLTITALPDGEAGPSFVLRLRPSKRRRIASPTAAPSMMAPSTMLSGGSDSVPNPVTLYDLPAAFNSTAFTADEPISSPTSAFALRNTDPPGNHFAWLSAVARRQVRCHPQSAFNFGRTEQIWNPVRGCGRCAITALSAKGQFCNLDNSANCRYPLGLPSFERY